MSPTSLLREDQSPYPCYLVDGPDPGLVSQELSTLIEQLSGLSGIGSEAIEEYATTDEAVVGPALDACRTPPFFTERRVVVIRELAAIDATQVGHVVEYLKDPLPSTVLVLVHDGRSVPAALAKAVRAGGVVIHAVPAATSRARSEWFAEHLDGAGVRLDNKAAALLQEHLGEDLARLEGVVATLESAFDEGSTVRVDDLEPYLGTAGAIAPWDLTDALDGGDANGALDALDRLLSNERHPLQVLAVLGRHYGAMLRLDGSNIVDEKAAAEATGMSPYPAKKALAQSRRLGHERVVRAVQLLAGADLDVRGRIGWPSELVLDVLIARLAQLSRQAIGRSGTRASGRRS